MKRKIVKIVSIVIAVMLVSMGYRLHKLGTESINLEGSVGLVDGQLKVCGNKPNCVSTSENRDKFKVEPISFEGDYERIKSQIVGFVTTELGGTVMKDEGRFVHFVCTSKLFKFKDDLEVYFPEGSNQIMVRSESRVGHSDLGANRKRVEVIRKLLAK